MSTTYVNFSEINQLQTKIMQFIDRWAHENRTPVPLKEIICEMIENGESKESTIYSLKILLQKGYLRRAVIISNTSAFVQLRRV